MSSVVVVVLAVLLLAVAVLLVRSSRVGPWPAIVTAALTSGICFTVGGESAKDATEPSIATVVAAVAGLLTVASAILALVPRVARPPFARLPTLLACTAIVVGAAGLVANQLAG